MERRKRILKEDKYEIISKLGKGGTATVYLVRHKTLDTLRAIKVIPKNQKGITSYFVEINILKNVRIEGVPLIYDVEEDEEFYYIVEEYIEGQSYTDYIKTGNRTKEELLDSICQICDIIINLHILKPYPVLYNDIKADNIVVNSGKVYIIDYGNCRILKKESKSSKELIMASLENVTPEHLEGKEADIKTDIYGMGMLIQEVYQNNKRILKKEGEIFNKIIKGCLEKEISERIPSVDIIKKYFLDIKKSYLNPSVKRVLSKKSKIDIRVYGCREYSGVTHFCFGLAKYLSDKKVNAVYIESRAECGVTKYINDKDKKGFYTYKDCTLFPYYGDFILESSADFGGVCIYDEGTYDEKSFSDGSVIILIITDKKSYGEIEYNELIKGINNEIIYVVNFSDIEGYRRFDRSVDKKTVYMPYFANPFDYGKEIKDFYKEIYNIVLKLSEEGGSK